MAKKDKDKPVAKTGKYSESDISGFTRDIEKIQAKPSLYIGELGQAGINTIVREPSDNGVDEARAGRNTLVNIMVPGDGSYWVQDEGVGIPVKMHPKMKISTLTHVLTNLQSSGKMTGDAYKSAIGTHGVGIKATNAFSKEFEVWTYRKDAGGWHYTKFAKGVEKVKVKKVDKPPKMPNGKRPKLGTILRFVPDETYFGKEKVNIEQLRNWCEMTSYMNVGLRIQLLDGKKEQEWYSKVGIREYLEKRLAKLKATPMSKKFVFHNSETLELAIHFADVEGSAMEFFTNTIRNVEEGVHADDMYKALVDALKPYKGKNQYTPTDLKEGLVGVLNYKINAPMFDSQTKEKLVDNRVKGECYKECLAALEEFFKENKSLAKQIVERAAELRKKTADFLKDKKLIKKVKGAMKGLSAKLADVSNSKTPVSERELYLVEGDSAGGTAKVARHKEFQATFSLKGKPLNVMETTKDKVNANKEIAGIFAGIGLDLSKKNPIDHIQFGKIIFLADPDVDGCHINTLLMTLFWKYLPDLYKQGRIYMLEAPEYMGKKNGEVYFGATVQEVYRQAGTEKIDVRHIKGWGELNAEDMQPIAFDVDNRRMYRILPPRDKNGILQFQMLMGKKSTYRQQLLGVVANGDGEDDEEDGKGKKKGKKAKADKPEKKVKAEKPAKGKKKKIVDEEVDVSDAPKAKKTKKTQAKAEKPAKEKKVKKASKDNESKVVVKGKAKKDAGKKKRGN
jgi:DNA gyrase subunit B